MSTESELERMLIDETVEPRSLPLPLLETITHGFSDNLVIGKGGFSVVYKGVLDNGVVIAVKKLHSSYISDKKFKREVECLMKVKHKNIVRFLGYCADTNGSMEIYGGRFVMADTQERLMCFEYLPKGSLRHYIKDTSGGLEWRKWYKIIKGICEGLEYLHKNYILHLDLKPANILMDEEMTPKIIDFGGSRCFEEKQTEVTTPNIFGTMGYLAPELLYSGKITYKTDLFSLGVIIKEILTGDKGYQDSEIILRNWGNISDMSQWEQIRVCTEIANECTDINPTNRPTSINHIMDKLLETEFQVVPAHAPSELLAVHPFELYFPFEPNKTIVCELKLTNKTDRHVAFRLMDMGGDSFLRLPLHGIVPPSSPYTLNVTTQEHKELPKKSNMDLILVSTFQMQAGNFFQQDKNMGDVVQEVNLKAFYIPQREKMNLAKCMLCEESLCEENRVPKPLPLTFLEKITNGFSDKMIIGRGHLAAVFKGKLDNGTVVAVRRLNEPYLYDKEFQVEVECLMKVKHKNIVRLLGYCAHSKGSLEYYGEKLVMADILERLLCFEYLPNGSLERCIQDSSGGLEWSKQYKIIKGICEGLNYLHQKSILHLGLVPKNILLDEEMMPKIIGFSHSRCLDEGQTCIIATQVFGKIGYLAPEFIDYKEITYKTDLYSLGVIIMQMLTGKRSYHDVEDVLESWRNILDSSEWEQIQVCAEIGRECTDFNASKRPVGMKHIIDRLLETESKQIILTGNVVREKR